MRSPSSAPRCSRALAGLACDLATAPSSRWSLASEHGVAWLEDAVRRALLQPRRQCRSMAAIPSASKDGKVWYSWTAFDADARATGSTATRRRLAAWGFNSAGGWSLPPQQLQPADDHQPRARPARHASTGSTRSTRRPSADDGAGPRARRALSRLALPDRLFLRQRGRLVGRRAVRVLLDEAGRQSSPSSAGSTLLRRHYGDDWQRFAADFVPPAGRRLMGRRCSPRER